MKTVIAILAAGAVLSFGTHNLSAGDREWATAGKILTGLVIGGAVAKALEPPPVYVAPTVVYAAPAHVIHQPQVVYAAPAPVARARQVIYTAPPVVYAPPAPVVIHPPPVQYVHVPAPVYYYPYAPRPVVGVHFSFGSGRHFHHHYRPHHRFCR
jgi:hypothetical protein